MPDAVTRPAARKILVLGATGMAGHVVSSYLSEQGHPVVGLARGHARGIETVSLDVLAFDELCDYISRGGFDVVVNCVGMLVEGSQQTPSTAVLVNSFLPHKLADFLSTRNTRLIHLSTDCVFEGDGAPYAETRRRDGQSFYDRSKGLGEIENDKDLTLRMSIIGPEIRAQGSGLMHWFLGESGSVNGYVNAIWNGITTLELSKAIDRIIETELHGIYHLVPDYSISKFALLTEIADVFGRGDLFLVPDASVTVNKTLVDTRHALDFHVGEAGYRRMLIELRDWIREHPDLYPTDSRYAIGNPRTDHRQLEGEVEQ